MRKKSVNFNISKCCFLRWWIQPIVMDSPKQASQIFEQPVANRSSYSEVCCRMCHNFHLMNTGVKLNFTCEKLLYRSVYNGVLRRTIKFGQNSIVGATLRWVTYFCVFLSSFFGCYLKRLLWDTLFCTLFIRNFTIRVFLSEKNVRRLCVPNLGAFMWMWEVLFYLKNYAFFVIFK